MHVRGKVAHGPCQMLRPNQLKEYDPSWYEHIYNGNAWEILDGIIDEEEPNATLDISVALNKRNEASMAAGHTEIFRALVDLCKPNPVPAVAGKQLQDEFEEVRLRMIDLYGSAVDHPDFHHCYRLVLDAGGRGSQHLKNLYEFTQVHVNPKVRNIRFDTYAMMAPLPHSLPRVKMALLKWTWKQPTTRGWCLVPPNLGTRVRTDSNTNLREAIDELERARKSPQRTSPRMWKTHLVSARW